MAVVDVYTPSSVVLPPELGLKRDILLKGGERPETRYDYYTTWLDTPVK